MQIMFFLICLMWLEWLITIALIKSSKVAFSTLIYLQTCMFNITVKIKPGVLWTDFQYFHKFLHNQGRHQGVCLGVAHRCINFVLCTWQFSTTQQYDNTLFNKGLYCHWKKKKGEGRPFTSWSKVCQNYHVG